MLGLGLSLTGDDFKRIVKQPKAMIVGLISQMLVLPLIAFGIAVSFDLEPWLAVGMLLLAACPDGSTSNPDHATGRGDTALSVSLTATSSFAILVTLPVIVVLSIGWFVGTDAEFPTPVGDIIRQVVAIAIVPVLIEMFIRRRWPDFAQRMETLVRQASIVLFTLIVVGLIVGNLDLIRENASSLGPAVLALNLLTMPAGYGLARLSRWTAVPTTVRVIGGHRLLTR